MYSRDGHEVIRNWPAYLYWRQLGLGLWCRHEGRQATPAAVLGLKCTVRIPIQRAACPNLTFDCILARDVSAATGECVPNKQRITFSSVDMFDAQYATRLR